MLWVELHLLKKAIGFFEQYKQINEDACTANPESEDLKNGMAISYEKLRVIFQAQGMMDEALCFFEKRAKLGGDLYAANPHSESLGIGLGVSFIKLAGWHKGQKNIARALEYYRKGLALYEQWHAITDRPDVGDGLIMCDGVFRSWSRLSLQKVFCIIPEHP